MCNCPELTYLCSERVADANNSSHTLHQLHVQGDHLISRLQLPSNTLVLSLLLQQRTADSSLWLTVPQVKQGYLTDSLIQTPLACVCALTQQEIDINTPHMHTRTHTPHLYTINTHTQLLTALKKVSASASRTMPRCLPICREHRAATSWISSKACSGRSSGGQCPDGVVTSPKG